VNLLPVASLLTGCASSDGGSWCRPFVASFVLSMLQVTPSWPPLTGTTRTSPRPVIIITAPSAVRGRRRASL